MKRIKLPKIVCMMCFLSIPMILFTFFFLPNLVSKHHNLFFNTYEFIVVAKPSRVAVFVMFNVIVITIFLGSPKPSAIEFELFYHPCPSVYYETDSAKESENNDEGDDSYDDEDDDDVYHGYDGYDEDNDDDLDTEDAVSEDETDVHLEKKIDEFIAKVYKKWREELHAERLLCLEPPS